MLRAAVHGDLQDDTGAFLCSQSTVNGMAFHYPPFAPRTPIAIEVRIRIVAVFLRMLLPIGIMHPDAVCALIIFLLQRREEPVGHVLFGPVTEAPDHKGQNHNREDYDGDNFFAAALTGKVWLRSIEQGHNYLSITETGSRSKVPELITAESPRKPMVVFSALSANSAVKAFA